jgi:hypothetical protein
MVIKIKHKTVIDRKNAKQIF